MKCLTLKRRSYILLCSNCSIRLIDYVFNGFERFGGIITIDEENVVDDTWELDNFHNDAGFNKLEIMKVMSVFCENGGMFIVDDKKMFFEGIVLNENHNEGTIVNKVWALCRLNETSPSFDLGYLPISPI